MVVNLLHAKFKVLGNFDSQELMYKLVFLFIIWFMWVKIVFLHALSEFIYLFPTSYDHQRK
ncbi:hypothetical protein ACE6H2_005820 [Prunus campanulata]